MHVNYIDWRVHPFRANNWLEAWNPALERAAAFGAKACYLTRSVDDPLHFRQVTIWSDTRDFDRYWASDEISALRQDALNYYNKPIAWFWHSLIAEASPGTAEPEPAEVSE